MPTAIPGAERAAGGGDRGERKHTKLLKKALQQLDQATHASAGAERSKNRKRHISGTCAATIQRLVTAEAQQINGV